jgi:hypothetical protein
MSDLTIRRLAARREHRTAAVSERADARLSALSDSIEQIEEFERSQCTLIGRLLDLFEDSFAAKENRLRRLESDLESAIIVRRPRSARRERHLKPVRDEE